jgi:hypothetical protein
MKASFYLTPDLKEKLLGLSLRTEDGQLHVWNNQPGTGLIERDPSKSINFLIVDTSTFLIVFSFRNIVSRHQGGIGLYVSLRDYLKLLQHILQILGKQYVQSLTRSQRNPCMGRC